MYGPPPDDPIAHRFAVAQAEAKLFGGPPQPVRVARFEVQRRIGEGGLGVVWAAHDPGLDRPVALKLLRPGAAGPRGDADRMLREARAMGRSTHPHVVTVYEVGEHDGQTFIAMELVDGVTLRTHLSRTQPDWRRALDLFLAAGRGLAAAHQAGVVHRDFKPENVLVGADGRVRVADFGLAHRPDAPDDLTAAGTLPYMAPEQHAAAAATPAADQFAFCVALYEALYGMRPFADARPDALAAAKAEGRFRAAPTDTHVPLRIWRALERGLSASPQDRWPDMNALLAQLEGAPATRRRRALTLVGVGLVLAVALFAAVLQIVMFSDWFAAARHR